MANPTTCYPTGDDWVSGNMLCSTGTTRYTLLRDGSTTTYVYAGPPAAGTPACGCTMDSPLVPDGATNIQMVWHGIAKYTAGSTSAQVAPVINRTKMTADAFTPTGSWVEYTKTYTKDHAGVTWTPASANAATVGAMTQNILGTQITGVSDFWAVWTWTPPAAANTRPGVIIEDDV